MPCSNKKILEIYVRMNPDITEKIFYEKKRDSLLVEEFKQFQEKIKNQEILKSQ